MEAEIEWKGRKRTWPSWVIVLKVPWIN